MLWSLLIGVHVFTMDNVTGIFLRKEVSELRKRGESWGLTKEEIDEAILRALGGKPHYYFKIVRCSSVSLGTKAQAISFPLGH